MVYLFFVGLSTIFWFLNALSKEYETDIYYAVHYVNLPKNKLIVNKDELPEKLQFRVKAYGFDLLRYKLSSAFSSHAFDVKKFTNNGINESLLGTYRLYTHKIRAKLEEDLSSGIRLEDINPDTISFHLSPILEKKLPVVFNSKLSYEKQFMQSGTITVEPDSVLARGPKAVLDSVSFVKTELFESSNLRKTVETEVGFEKIEGLDFLPRKLKIKIPVERFTEAKRNISIQVDNLPDSVFLRLFPAHVNLSYFVPLNKYESISKERFDFRVNYLDAMQSGAKKIKVELTKIPGFVENVNFYPKTVSFLIEKKNNQIQN